MNLSPRLPIRAAKRGLRAVGVLAAVGACLVLAGPGSLPGEGVTTAAHAQNAPPWFGFADIVDRIKPAVISVRTEPDVVRPGKAAAPAPGDNPLDEFFRRFLPDDDSVAPRGQIARQGSGFFVSPDGYAVTNNHVVDGAKTVEVTADSGKVYTARVIGTDERTDIALIKVDGHSDFPTAKFAERIPRVGDWVLAVGNPFGLGGTVTAGIVSARGRDIGAGPYDDFIQIDAPVNQGNSGGPTFNVEGNVIGVNTAIVSPSGGSVGIGFAIPAETVKSVISQLKDKGKVTRGWIGVQIQSITPELAENLALAETRGALVSEPEANGPASKAGIEAGDIVTAVNGKPISDSRELARTISALPPGTQVKLSVARKGQDRAISVTLGELPDQRQTASSPGREPTGANFPQLGFTVAPKAGQGLVVTDVDADGTAAERGMKTGDVILEAGGKKVANAAELRNAVQAAEKGGKRTVLMRVRSGSSTRYVTLPVGRG
jgi:serine protease Do